MIEVPSEFLDKMQYSTDFFPFAEITLLDGTAITLDESDFTNSNNYIVDGGGISSFPVGVAVQRRIQLELLNDQEQFSGLEFYGGTVKLFVKYYIGDGDRKQDVDNWYTINKGTFTIVNPYSTGETIIIEAYDDMVRADTTYSTFLTFPATLGDILSDLCNTVGIKLKTRDFRNSDYVVRSKPQSGYTARQIIGFIAMIAGGNARISMDGFLEIINYAFNVNTIDGGDFTFSNEDTIDGGDFTFSNEDTIDGGAFVPWNHDDPEIPDDANQEQLLTSWSSLTADLNDITITGMKLSYSTSVGTAVVQEGSSGYVLSVTNPLVAENPEYGLHLMSPSIIGLTFRKFRGDSISNPLVEFMDTVYIKDRRGRIYKSFVTDVNFVFCGNTTISNNAESAIRESVVYSSDAKDAEVRNTENIKNSSGMYETTIMQDDRSIIYYFHDRPTITDSGVVMRLNSDGIYVSTDGGKNYNFGFAVTGEMIANILSADGIVADWIRSGSLRTGSINAPEIELIPGESIDESTLSRFVMKGYDWKGNLTDKMSISVYPYQPQLETPVVMDTPGGFELTENGEKIMFASTNNVIFYNIVTASGGVNVYDSRGSGGVTVYNSSGKTTSIGAVKAEFGGDINVSGSITVGGNKMLVFNPNGYVTWVDNEGGSG